MKINDQFFFKFKKPNFRHFFPISLIFWEKEFPPKIGLSCTTSYGSLAPCKNSEKSNDPIPRKHPDR